MCPTTHTTRPADAIAATAPRPALGPLLDSALHTVGAKAPRDVRDQEVQLRYRQSVNRAKMNALASLRPHASVPWSLSK